MAGFCSSLREVEHNSVIHISIQFWNEPWLYGLEDEKSDARSRFWDILPIFVWEVFVSFSFQLLGARVYKEGYLG